MDRMEGARSHHDPGVPPLAMMFNPFGVVAVHPNGVLRHSPARIAGNETAHPHPLQSCLCALVDFTKT